ncbi:Glyoxylase, beta-lactamase superfamily II [Sphingomonas sp. YR710]|uniref:MBL fold metallo-hydrolase n=1 Tax=Sphingomonas sp. YR710 TaxID=1882773 RepID=UPI000883F83F|nr:MBL fold metallo-hydrolase [Sphingomonas sp. YR710]SDC59791.1 Glyoxylase, beta-lactamase superfamily II [Sphingomonas sp. YR710]
MAWWRIFSFVLAMGSGAIASVAAKPVPPVPVLVAKGVWTVSGGITPDRQPDGNSVIFDAPGGLIVFDTGRHVWHRNAILALAREEGKPIAAIINSHWHLDHVSGNPALRAAFPHLRVYASAAIDGALAGFLPDSVRQSEPYLNDPALPAATRDDIRADMATIANGPALRPDMTVIGSHSLRIAGRQLMVRLAANAATAGDVWLYDGKTRIVVTGDLVTLPAPFLDTACPEGWQRALARITATPFRTLIPGHGPPMTPPQFALYRHSFDAFIACVGSSEPKTVCAAAWTEQVRPLLGDDPVDGKRAQGMATYYVEMLRANRGRSKYCAAPAHH